MSGESRSSSVDSGINFIDTANRYLPKPMKKKGLRIHGSNLCNEIHLPTNEERTAVCCLSSLNLELYDEWKDTDVVKDLITFLDNVLQFFIDHAPDQISRARYSATQERSLGLGAMGLHSLYQKHEMPFDSLRARTLNEEIFKKIKPGSGIGSSAASAAGAVLGDDLPTAEDFAITTLLFAPFNIKVGNFPGSSAGSSTLPS